jgi:5S rRNA maturation endonuclease (ribonuclease M5)
MNMTSKDELKQLREEAYRIISDNPCSLFPEFEFRRNGKGWYSTNSRKIDGTFGTSVGKVWIYFDRAGYLFDFRGNQSISFWDYLEKYRGITEPFNALLDYAGLSLPAPTYSKDYDPKAPIELVADIHPHVLRAFHELAMQDMGTSDIGCEVRAYLGSRGYSDDDADIRRMKLGSIPELATLKHRLKEKLPKLEEKYINFFCKRMEYYTQHPLVIPCYGVYGALEGFIFRQIQCERFSINNELPKYKNLKNLNREAGILNIPRDATEIIILEGVLDALLMKARGVRNAVSLNGCGMNEAQCNMLAEAGIKRVILLLDNDDAGRDATLRITQRLLAHAHPFEIYISEMPQGFKDPEEFLLQHDAQALMEEIHHAIGMGEYVATQLIKQYPKRDESRPLPAMQRTRLLEAAEPIKEQLASFPYELADFERVVKMAVEG